jgi:hypothetical protein
MKTVICNRIEYVLASEVHYIALPDIIVLKPGLSFKSIAASEKPEYAQEDEPPRRSPLSARL